MPTAKKVSGVRELLARIEPREHDMVALAQRLVEIESPSHDKKAVDTLRQALAGEFTRIGAQVSFHKQSQFGDHLQASFKAAGNDNPSVLLIGHMDTVWHLRTLKSMPCRISDGRVWGPRVLDMKAGIGQMSL